MPHSLFVVDSPIGKSALSHPTENSEFVPETYEAAKVLTAFSKKNKEEEMSFESGSEKNHSCSLSKFQTSGVVTGSDTSINAIFDRHLFRRNVCPRLVRK